MKKYLAFATILILAVVLISPFSVSAKTKAGAKPGSFFYFFDKAFEKTSLFFIFNSEKKAKKILEYAEERLAEAEELEKEKEEKEIIKDKKETTEIKKEETEISEKDIEKADNKLEEDLEKENNEETEIKDDKKEETKSDKSVKEIEKLKKEIEALKQKTSQIKVVEKIVEKTVVVESKQSSSSQTKQKEITLPNGAVVEMDENGSVVKTIKEAPKSTYVTPTSATQTQTNMVTQTSSSIVSISSPKIKLSMISNSAKAIPSASNQIIAKFLIYSDDSKVNSNKSVLKLSISNGTGKAGDLSNFLLVDKNGTIVAGPIDPNNESVLTFTDTITFPKGTMEYTLMGNIGSNFSSEQWIYVNANVDNWILNLALDHQK